MKHLEEFKLEKFESSQLFGGAKHGDKRVVESCYGPCNDSCDRFYETYLEYPGQDGRWSQYGATYYGGDNCASSL